MNRILAAMICVLGLTQGIARSESLGAITIDEALIFATPAGEVVNVQAGGYTIDVSQADILSLMSPEGDAVTVEATSGTHDLEIVEPILRFVGGEEESGYLLVAFLPNGESAHAIGSRSGVTSRGKSLTAQQFYIEVAIAPSVALTPMGGSGRPTPIPYPSGDRQTSEQPKQKKTVPVLTASSVSSSVGNEPGVAKEIQGAAILQLQESFVVVYEPKTRRFVRRRVRQ